MSLFTAVSNKKREQRLLEASQILTHAVYELHLPDPIFRHLEDRLHAIYRREIPRLQPRTIIAALFLGTAQELGVYVGTKQLAEATGCSTEWLKKLKSRLFGPYRELLEEISANRALI
ncbi:MAG: hypothetical protein ACE5OZ_16200 [Candidatus Heimdallarchaeota archaeon]